MKFRRLPLSRTHEATGTAVVVDVLRAFTTAAYAIDRGAASIQLVSNVDHARTLRAHGVVDLAIGEIDGLPVEGFDLPNSPSALRNRDLTGRRLAMRTTAGTQGAVNAVGAMRLLTGAFVNAHATARAVRDADRVTFIVTGANDQRPGDEDHALADYVTALLRGARPDPAPFLERVRASDHARRFGIDLPHEDLDLACELDVFGTALEVHREDDGALVIRP